MCRALSYHGHVLLKPLHVLDAIPGVGDGHYLVVLVDVEVYLTLLGLTTGAQLVGDGEPLVLNGLSWGWLVQDPNTSLASFSQSSCQSSGMAT